MFSFLSTYTYAFRFRKFFRKRKKTHSLPMGSDSLRGHVAFLDALSIPSNSLTGRQRKKLLAKHAYNLPVAGFTVEPRMANQLRLRPNLEYFHSKHLEKLMSEYESEPIGRECVFVNFK